MKVRLGPSGVHLFERSTGLNILLDEVDVPRSLWATAPRFVSVALTNLCDLSCPYCYAPKNRTLLKAERVSSWLDELESNGCLGVGLGGGEPTLYPQLAELCRHVAQETRMAVSLTTHGHRLNDTLAASLSGSLHFVRVSMDGVGATYESLRGRHFGAFRRQLEIISGIAPFGLNYVVNERTLPDLDAALDLAAEVGAKQFLLLPEQPSRGRVGIDTHTAQEFRRWVNAYRGSMRLAVSEAGAHDLPTCDPLASEGGISAYAFVDADGTLRRSSFRDAVMESLWFDKEDPVEWPLDIIGFDCYQAEQQIRFVLNCSNIEWAWRSKWPVISSGPQHTRPATPNNETA